MKKKMIALLLLAVLAVCSLTACGKTESGNGSLLEEIKNRGYLIVGTEGTWSPYTFHNENDELVGFEVEVAKYIADYIGVDIQYTETAWSSIFAALDAGQIDIVVNSVAYTDERAEKYDFSIPYNYSQYAFMTLADNDEIQTLEDVKGRVSANDPTSNIGKFAEAAGVVFDEVKETAQAFSEIRNGRAEVTFSTLVGLTDYFRQHPEEESLYKVIIASDPTPTGYVPVLKGNSDLVEVINEALEQAKKDGTLSDLAMKYFGVDTTKG